MSNRLSTNYNINDINGIVIRTNNSRRYGRNNWRSRRNTSVKTSRKINADYEEFSKINEFYDEANRRMNIILTRAGLSD